MANDKIAVSWMSREINACSEEILEIEWTPSIAGSWREILQISHNRLKLKRDIAVVFRSVDKNKVS